MNSIEDFFSGGGKAAGVEVPGFVVLQLLATIVIARIINRFFIFVTLDIGHPGKDNKYTANLWIDCASHEGILLVTCVL
jgi:hypothetical protein